MEYVSYCEIKFYRHSFVFDRPPDRSAHNSCIWVRQRVLFLSIYIYNFTIFLLCLVFKPTHRKTMRTSFVIHHKMASTRKIIETLVTFHMNVSSYANKFRLMWIDCKLFKGKLCGWAMNNAQYNMQSTKIMWEIPSFYVDPPKGCIEFSRQFCDAFVLLTNENKSSSEIFKSVDNGIMGLLCAGALVSLTLFFGWL